MVSIYSDTNAKVVVETFTRQRDGEDIIIGRPEVGSFLAIPSEAIDALDLLARGKTIGEVGQYYLDKDGEVPDLTEFLEMLSVHGFISTLGQDSKKNAVKSAGSRSSIRFHFASFPEELAQKIFGPATVSICIILSLVAVGLCYLDRSLIPRSSSIYFPFSRTLSIALLILEGYFALVLHEFSHLVAARAAGVDSKFGLGHRLWYIVAETDLTGLWSVPKERRYLPFLAGVLVDATSGAVLIILIFCCRRGWPPLSPFWTNLVKAMIFAYAMRIVWQCFLFVRTDFYYVIANFFGCRNLLGDTEAYLRNLIAPILTFVKRTDLSGIPGDEMRVIRIYAGLWLAGRAIALWFLVFVTVPVAVRYLRSTISILALGYSAHPASYIDSLLFLAFSFVPLTIGITLWLRGILYRERLTT